MTPLHWAALLGQTNVVYHLVRLGANINALDAHGRTPLVHSIFKKRVDTTDLLYNLNARECAHDARWDAQLFFQTGFPEFGRCALSRMNHTE
jgi:ankyrin repeat protein